MAREVPEASSAVAGNGSSLGSLCLGRVMRLSVSLLRASTQERVFSQNLHLNN